MTALSQFVEKMLNNFYVQVFLFSFREMSETSFCFQIALAENKVFMLWINFKANTVKIDLSASFLSTSKFMNFLKALK